MGGKESARTARWLRLTLAGLVMAVVGAGFLVAAAGPASASSYPGSGDWSIPAGTTEVVANQTVTVAGSVYVHGNLSFENAALVVTGGPFPPGLPLPGQFVPGNVSVDVGATLGFNASTFTGYGRVKVNGTMYVNTSQFSITSNNGSRNSGVFVGEINLTGSASAYNSTFDLLGLFRVAGNFTMIGASLTFGQDLYGNQTQPFGFRAAGTAAINVLDLDGSNATMWDASTLAGSGNGTYSVFQPGSYFYMRNSYGSNLGWAGYPGFEFNASYQVGILGSTFTAGGNGPEVPPLDGLRALLVANNCYGVRVTGSSFAGISLPVVLRGGWNHVLSDLTVVRHAVGVQIDNASYVSLQDLSFREAGVAPGYAGWAGFGNAVALRGGSDISVVRLSVAGNDTAAEYQPLRGIYAEGVANLTIGNVTVIDAGGFISVVGGRSLTLLDLVAVRVGRLLEVAGTANVRIERASLQGDAPSALWVSNSPNVTVTDFSGSAQVGVRFEGSSNVTLTRASVSVTQTGLSFAQGSRFEASAVQVSGNGTGLIFVNATDVGLMASTFEFSREGLVALIGRNVAIQGVNFTVAAGAVPVRFLHVDGVNGFSLSRYTYAGACGSVGSISGSSVVSIDALLMPGCETGLSVTSTAYFMLPLSDLRGAWNGTALGLYSVTDAQVTHADLSDAAYVGLALIGSSRVSVSNFTVSGAGLDGIFVQQGGAIDLTDGEALGVGGRGLAVVNASAPVTLTRLKINGSGSGVEVITSPGLVFVDVESSRSAGDGVNFDAASTGASLRDLTLRENGGAGLRMDAAGASLIDGNISSNVGEGISPGASVRLDWHVEVAASFVDGRTRFTGDLLVSAGASFLAERAAFHLDPGPRQMPLSPPPLINLAAGARAVFDRVTFDSTNDSAPYTLEMGTAASVEILGSFFHGSGRGLYASAIQGGPDFLAIRNSTFVAFSRPLAAFGSLVEMSDVNYSDNDVGPRLAVQSLTFFNLTVENSTGAGLEVLGVPVVRGERLLARWNAGLGAHFASVSDLALSTSEAYENLQGGLLLDRCVADLQTTSVAGNAAFGLRLQGGGRAALTVLQAYGNSGAGLAAEDLDYLSVDQALIYGGLGRGIELTRVSFVRLDRAEFYDNAAFGLVALDVGNLTVVGARFAGNGVSHIVLQGRTVALFVDGALERSPGDAVALNGSASGTFVAVAVDGAVARVAASEASFAYLLNSTFAAPFVLGGARVDIAWNLSAVARREAGAPVVGATVTVVDSQGALVASEVTGADGSTRTFTLMAKSVFAGGSFLAFSPHTFSASLPGGGGARLSVEVDRYMVVNLTIDGTAPVTMLTLEGEAGTGGWFLGPVTARLRAEDASGYGVTLFWRLASGPWRNGTSAGNFTEDVIAVDAEGSTLLEYYAVDGVANTEAVRGTLVKIDLSAPTATFENLPANVTGGEFGVRWDATDTAGSACCTYSTERAYGDLPFEPWANGTDAGALFTPTSEGTYRFRLTAFDGAGRASRPVTGALVVYLNGTVRIAVADHTGTALASAAIVVEGTNISLAGAGPFEIRLAAGAYRVTIRAPGFVPRTLEATVVSHNITDLGVLELERLPETVTNEADQGPLGLVLLLVAIGASAAIFSLRKSRQKGK